MGKTGFLCVLLCMTAVGLSACGEPTTAETASPAAGSSGVSATSAGPPTTTITETSAPSPSVPAANSVELGSGTLRYIVPLDASVDPSRWPNVPAEVIGYAWWLTDCCLLKVIVESIDPPRPANEVVETFSAGGLDWTIYDSGPRDGTAMDAQATGDFGTVIISAQSSSPQQGSKPSDAHDVVVSLARTVTFAPNA